MLGVWIFVFIMDWAYLAYRYITELRGFKAIRPKKQLTLKPTNDENDQLFKKDPFGHKKSDMSAVDLENSFNNSHMQEYDSE